VRVPVVIIIIIIIIIDCDRLYVHSSHGHWSVVRLHLQRRRLSQNFLLHCHTTWSVSRRWSICDLKRLIDSIIIIVIIICTEIRHDTIQFALLFGGYISYIYPVENWLKSGQKLIESRVVDQHSTTSANGMQPYGVNGNVCKSL